MDSPFWNLFYPLASYVSEFRNEVGDHLSLNGSVRAVLYVELTQLYCPYSSNSFGITYCSP